MSQRAGEHGSGRGEFSWIEGIAFGMGAMGLLVASEFIHGWGAYFYSPTEDTQRTIYVAVALMGTVFFIGMLFDAVTDPLIGIWSDRTKTRRGWARIVPLTGRRRPFMFWGSILMTVSGMSLFIASECTTISVTRCVGEPAVTRLGAADATPATPVAGSVSPTLSATAIAAPHLRRRWFMHSSSSSPA